MAHLNPKCLLLRRVHGDLAGDVKTKIPKQLLAPEHESMCRRKKNGYCVLICAVVQFA